MGKRLLEIDGQFLVDFHKQGNNEIERWIRVTKNALPDDTQLVGIESTWDRTICLVLESDQWWGDSRVRLSPIEMIVNQRSIVESIREEIHG